MRWTMRPGSVVLTQAQHAQSVAGRVREAVRAGAPEHTLARVAALLEEVLRETHDAGVREGRSAERAAAAEHIRSAVARAVASIAIDGAPCPHCSGVGHGCGECAGSGRRTA